MFVLNAFEGFLAQLSCINILEKMSPITHCLWGVKTSRDFFPPIKNLLGVKFPLKSYHQTLNAFVSNMSSTITEGIRTLRIRCRHQDRVIYMLVRLFYGGVNFAKWTLLQDARTYISCPTIQPHEYLLLPHREYSAIVHSDVQPRGPNHEHSQNEGVVDNIRTDMKPSS